MIGGILGGTASMRLGSALRNAEMESMNGKRLLIVSALPRLFPVAGGLPEALAPGFAHNRPVDVLAESYASVQGVDAAAAFFSEAALSGQGGGVHRDSNDVYWFESMRSGLASLFRIAGLLACRKGETRSLNRILCDCFDDLYDAVSRTSPNGTPERPKWLEIIPEEVRRPVQLNYLGKAGPSTYSHLSTLAVAVGELRRGAPESKTAPFAAMNDGAPLFIYAPAWGNAALNILLRICMRGNYALLLPEVHLWPEAELLRVGHALRYGASGCSVVWTSLSVPAHPAFDSDWEIFGKSSSSDVLGLFRARLNRYGAEGESRLKDLKYETLASLDDLHALQRTPSGWSIVPCTPFDERETVELEGEITSLSKEDIFLANMAELAVFAPEPPAAIGPEEPFEEEFSPKAPRGSEKPLDSRTAGGSAGDKHKSGPLSGNAPEAKVRIVEGVPETIGSGKYGYCTINGETILLKDVCIDRIKYVAVLGKEVGKPQCPLAFYEKLWSAVIPPEKEILGPRVDAFVPVVVDPEKASPAGDGSMEVYSPRYGRSIRLVFHGLREMPSEKEFTAFGTWKEPRSVLLVRSLLKPLAPLPPVSGKRRRATRLLTGRWKEVYSSGERLRDFMETALDELSDPSGLSDETSEKLASLRSEYEENASLAMDRLHEDGKPEKRLENRGVVCLDMETLNNRDEAWEALCAADISSLPPAGYRERLKRRGLHEKYTGSLDAVFASLLLNLEL